MAHFHSKSNLGFGFTIDNSALGLYNWQRLTFEVREAVHPIETDNIILICVGVLLQVGGIVIIYRTIMGMVRARKKDARAPLHLFSNALNLVIAVVFMVAGVLFVINNLRGNQLKEAAPTSKFEAPLFTPILKIQNGETLGILYGRDPVARRNPWPKRLDTRR